MDRFIWLSPIYEKRSPAYPCPYCENTISIFTQSFNKYELKESKDSRNNVDWDPEWIRYGFTTLFKCNSPDCGGEVVMAGRGAPELREFFIEDNGVGQDYFEEFTPYYCWPMPDIIKLPPDCPKEVQVELRAAFRLFWADQAAAAGRIRISLERLMDHYRIPKRARNASGKFYELSLHKRIQRFSTIKSGTEKKLLAVKWLGNTGSHTGSVSKDDILDAFEILEFLLAHLFVQREDRAEALARNLTKKHGRQKK